MWLTINKIPAQTDEGVHFEQITMFLKGDISMDEIRKFVSLDVRRVGKTLHVEKSENIGPIKK